MTEVRKNLGACGFFLSTHYTEAGAIRAAINKLTHELPIQKEEKCLTEKICKNCNEPFYTENPEKRPVPTNVELPILKNKKIKKFQVNVFKGPGFTKI